jgi:VWFA-related protein
MHKQMLKQTGYLVLFAALCLGALAAFAVARAAAQGRRAGPVQSFPTPPPDDDQTAQQSQPTVKTVTIVVPVRVVVRDPQGHAVVNLTKDDFKLSQDGKQQDIVNFLAVANPVNFPKPPNGTESPAATPSGGSIATQASSPALPQRFVALFFDDVHLDLQDMMRARDAADRFVRSSLEPADRVAIFTVSGQSQQDFTSDRDALHKSLQALLPHVMTAADPESAGDCPPMDFPEADAIANQGMTQVLAVATQDALNCAYSGEEHFRPEAQDLATRTAEHLVFAQDEQTEAAFRRIREVVRRVSGAPGQRDVVLISPGFLYPGHDEELAQIIDNAIHSDVVINTLDARGLYAPAAGGDVSQASVAHMGGGEALLNSFRAADNTLASNVLGDLADSTGGMAFANSNDFGAGLRALAAAPEVYYLLAYTPRNLKTDGHYHHIKVTLNAKQDYAVEARHGFYAPARAETPEQTARREIDDELFANDEKHDLPVELQTRVEKNKDGGKQLDVYADLDIAHLRFQKANGVNQEGLTMVAALFDNNGNYVDGTQKVLNFNLKDATLADLSKTGASSELNFTVKPGAYTVRLVVRDANDQHVSAENVTVDVPE